MYPVVTLSDTHMNTRFGGRQRPHLKVQRFIALGGNGGAVEGPATKKLTKPTAAEEIGDEVRY
jgi:hypothetical protein